MTETKPTTYCIFPYKNIKAYKENNVENTTCIPEECPKLKRVQNRTYFHHKPAAIPEKCGYNRDTRPYMNEKQLKEHKKQVSRRGFQQSVTTFCPSCGHGVKTASIRAHTTNWRGRTRQRYIGIGFICFRCGLFTPSERFDEAKEIYGKW